MTTSETIAIAAAAVRLYAESHPRPIQVTVWVPTGKTLELPLEICV